MFTELDHINGVPLILFGMPGPYFGSGFAFAMHTLFTEVDGVSILSH